jgi:hypothetical protein
MPQKYQEQQVIEPYEEDIKCPKCGCGANTYTYCHNDGNEYLNIRCGQCGYEWKIATKDRQDG